MNESINHDDVVLGAKVISYAVQALGFLASMALASACSSVVIGIIVAIISTIVLTLLASVAAFFITTAMSPQHVAYVGAATNSLLFKFAGLFGKASA